MKTVFRALATALLAAAGLAIAADNPAPPPPAPAESSTPSSADRKGRGAGRSHRALGGLLKRVEEKGKLTKEEFLNQSKKRAEEIFSRLDKNNDSVIDKSEVAALEGQGNGLRKKTGERGKGPRPRPRPGAPEKSDGAKPSA